ncbi:MULTISPECIES: chloramphenicol phosphotransferase CPT family protein [Paenibacillus]|uniref:chloramphenicol phosphotransferase CPT family protein n=1 Tax=Paenibacillus TaxID=44249 RepID=UPI00096CF763|nr:zeta toxin family protein [Paenibacillus odorifer]OMD18527.1 chemotaxis protein [Paenibacillus odorifer]
MNQGVVVLLNGASSSGKTSISVELKNQKVMPFHHLSREDFFGNYNDFIKNTFPNIKPTREVDDQVASEILFDPIISVYYATIKLFSEMGLNVIVDTVIDDDNRFNEYHDLLIDLPTLFVGVLCSRDGLIRREHIRGDRALGLALYQYDKVYSFAEYDLEVNTEKLSPAECADKILRFINHDLSHSVFKKLSKREIRDS